MSQESKKMPEVPFGEHKISRLVVGSNQQNGASHQSLYKWQKTREEILSVLPEVPLDGHGGWEVYLPSELGKMLESIKAASKMCLAFKLFAGGRACSTPAEVGGVFANVLESIKPGDAVIVGMYPRFNEQMVKENADHVKRLG